VKFVWVGGKAASKKFHETSFMSVAAEKGSADGSKKKETVAMCDIKIRLLFTARCGIKVSVCHRSMNPMMNSGENSLEQP
jgi:hypothetical protein